MIELLAPAGNPKSFEVAIQNGADAVYLGLDDFNARMKAENFTKDNIRDFVERAHFYGVKVYVTINTIVKEDEFEKLIEIVQACVQAKVDAYLIQDLGVAYVLKNRFKGICLHASTQLGIHNLYGAKVAEKIGFKRIVLSRETKLEDIKLIHENTSLEIEYFVQGALCVAFSGNCYLSSKECDASGNRGLCKQLCRLPYTAKVGGETQEGYLLSTKDLCLANSLQELIDAGVCSFKIEGRLRHEGYVGVAVRAYRKLLDGTTNKLSNKDLTSLKTVYNRGNYTTRAYLDPHTPDAMIEKKINNHMGVEIGQVVSCKPYKEGLFEIVLFIWLTVVSCKPYKEGLFEIVLFSQKQLHPKDGIKFFHYNKEVASLGVGDVKEVGKNQYKLISKTKVQPKWRVHLILDATDEEQVLNQKRFVPIQIYVRANMNEPLCIEARYQDISVKKESEVVLEKAKTQGASVDDIILQASKVQDLDFVVDKCTVETNGVFLIKSIFNALRREVTQLLKEKIIQENEKEIVVFDEPIQIINPTNNQEESLTMIDAQRMKSVYLHANEKVVLYPSAYSVMSIVNIIKQYGLKQEDVILRLPIIANSKDLVKIEELLKEFDGIKTLLSENIYGFYFATKEYQVIAGAGHNIANIYANKMANDLGAFAITKSIEFKDFSTIGKVYKMDNELPYMTFAHCPYKTLYQNDCKHCSYKPNLTLTRQGKTYQVDRRVISQCYFELKRSE